VKKPILDGRTKILMGNPDVREMVIYPINDNLVNWAFVVRVQHSGARVSPMITDWNSFGRMEDIFPLFSEMKLRSSIIVNEFLLTDRDPLPEWTYGWVTLLGDAAHPMYPMEGTEPHKLFLMLVDLSFLFASMVLLWKVSMPTIIFNVQLRILLFWPVDNMVPKEFSKMLTSDHLLAFKSCSMWFHHRN
jgi:hypothetical protein